MHFQFIAFLRGYVKVEVRGKHLEIFLNQAIKQSYGIWNVHRTDNNRLRLNLLIRDFFRLRPLLKETSCRIHVVTRYGLPFVLDKLERRKFFAAGIVGFIAGLYVLSSIVWQVHVQGNDKIPTEQILQAARKQGIYAMQWKFKLKDPDTLSRAMMNELPGTAWVGVQVKGAQIQIEVVESVEPEKKPLLSPRNLVSRADAVITDIHAEKGLPLVKPNTRVQKGDILISGRIGEGENSLIVVSKGYVRGLVWHEYEIEIPLVLRYKVYTGESRERLYLVAGSKALQITGYGGKKFAKHESQTERKTLQWRNISLPAGWMTEKLMEVKFIEQKLEMEAAKTLGLQQARADILLKSGKGAQIKEENILHEKIESGKVYMKVLIEVDEEISIEQPIIQGE